MDVVVTSPMTGTEPQRHPYDTLHMNNEAASPRRHIRYTSPDTSTPHSPRRISDTATNHSVISSANGDQTFSTTDRTSPAISPFLVAHVLQGSEPNNTTAPPEINGQNHDRMEMDVDSDDSVSENQSHAVDAVVEDATEAPNMAMRPADGETMDTTQDSPVALDSQQALDPGSTVESSAFHPSSPTTHLEGLVHISSNGSTVNEDSHGAAVALTPSMDDNPFTWHSSSAPPPAPSTEPAATPRLDIFETNQTERGEIPPANPNGEQPPDIAPPPPEWEGERDEDSQDDDSTDEEDYSFWTNLKEDTSGPDEEELKAIEEGGHEISALDHEHWEKLTYEPLDDPEYVPGETGQIKWNVVGVNGTAEKPNKEREMRSPSVLIGGHYWNIKYYPRGNPNEGTEQLSIYIECSNAPYDDSKRKTVTKVTSDSASESQQAAPGRTDPGESLRENSIAGADSTAVADSIAAAAPEQQPEPTTEEEYHPPQTSETENSPITETPWEIAAQVCCVIYNPGEPRVHVAQRSSHRYCNENNDWGWTRFHGPWDDIHKRQRFKRQALLRNDTLAFTVYIRTIKDDTGALWWHAPKDKNGWDSVARIGLKRLVHGDEVSHSSALIAALSAWLYLGPVIDAIGNIPIPDPVTESKNRIRPLTDALQQLVQENRRPRQISSSSQSFEISLDNIAKIISWYGEDCSSSKKDVVATWETIQRIINYEASDVEDMADASDFFPDVWTLKQSDVKRENRAFDGRIELQDLSKPEPDSVQESITSALGTDSVAAKLWRTATSRQCSRKCPSVLQIELNRQKFFSDTRRWKRLTHRIKIDENITVGLPSGEKISYTLYGMVVHSGALESNDYYSVIRPAGPGTAWVKYAGDKDSKGVTRLTTKQARESHEGKGKNAEGTSAVAYVALYVLTNALSEILVGSELRELPRNLGNDSSDAITPAPENGGNKRALVQVYQSDIFKHHHGRGIVDPWVCCPHIYELEFEFEVSKTLAAVEEHLVEQFTKTGRQERFRLWALDTKPQTSVRGTPRFVSSLKANFRLEELISSCGGARFWLQLIPSNQVQEMTQLDREEPAPPANSESAEARAGPPYSNPPPDHVMQEPEAQAAADEIMQGQEVSGSAEGSGNQEAVHTPSEALILQQEFPAWPETPTQEQENSPSGSTESQEIRSALEENMPLEQEQNLLDEPILTGTTPGIPDDSISRHNSEAANGEDIIMDEPQEPKASEMQVLASPTDRSLSWISGTERIQKAHLEMIYFFLKVFDCNEGTLIGLGSYFAKRDEQIGDVMRRIFAVDRDEAFDIFHERSLTLSKEDRLKPSNTFEEVDGTALDGSVFILQRQSSETEKAKLEAEGKCTNPIDFFAWLRYHDDRSYLQDHRLESYFGSSYAFTAQKFGRPHGPGVLITMSGDAYSGNFVVGNMSGEGSMAYSNGDTYTGQWSLNEPNGQGQMVYAKTGNVYIGGFKKRKRHGKGTMHFEVADEEMQMCNICYEEEMDALFYDCGHVTACQECAKQVDICPVCRKSVRAVVKIWRT